MGLNMSGVGQKPNDKRVALLKQEASKNKRLQSSSEYAFHAPEGTPKIQVFSLERTQKHTKFPESFLL